MLTPSPGYAVTLDTYNGNDFALTGNSAINFAPVYTNRMLYDGVATIHPTGALTLIANYDNGTQLGDGTGEFVTSHWNGIAAMRTTRSPRVRYFAPQETFHDINGSAPASLSGLQSNTATINYTPGSNSSSAPSIVSTLRDLRSSRSAASTR